MEGGDPFEDPQESEEAPAQEQLEGSFGKKAAGIEEEEEARPRAQVYQGFR
jgi:hypothetical protein